jgi:predicted hotdog family 3-hydroxylacyl-ACP dehydratase
MNFDEIDIQELLPQRPPFLAVDRLLHFDKVCTKTSLQIRGDSLFCQADCLSEAGLIENIAQTCAARMGYMNSICGERVRIGFIGSIRQMNIVRLPRVGEVVYTEIKLVEEIFQMTLVTAEVFVGEETIASGEMKISITSIESKE